MVATFFIYVHKIILQRLKAVKNAKTKELLGFDNKASWNPLQEDKGINALYDGVFPGTFFLHIEIF